MAREDRLRLLRFLIPQRSAQAVYAALRTSPLTVHDTTQADLFPGKGRPALGWLHGHGVDVKEGREAYTIAV